MAVASMSATLERILEDDVAPHTYDDEDDEAWLLATYPDEGKPAEPWSAEPPEDLRSGLELVPLIDPAWFYKKDGNRYQPSQDALLTAKALLPGISCSSGAYAAFMKQVEHYYEEDDDEYCHLCPTRKTCVCEEAWAINGDTLRFWPEGWVDARRKWRPHGLGTIGEIQAERHPVSVCECPWEVCPFRTAAGYADWKAEFLVGL